MLFEDDTRLVKIFLHITPKEQIRRFRVRLTDPLKRWKLSYEDFRNHARWKDYELAIEDFDSSAIEMIGTLLGFSDADDPELAEFRKRADQTECNAFTRRGVEEELAPFALLKYCAA